MEVLLGKVTQQAMNYAIRSGITITSTYAIKQCTRLLQTVPLDEREELESLQLRLDSKIRIISPAIDMIELIAARGNTSLESAVTLTKALRWDIQSLGNRLAKAAAEEELIRNQSSKTRTKAETQFEFQRIVGDIKKLLARIEDAVPLINLAITTSGANLSTNLPASVSPSRLLQASTFLTAGDGRYCSAPLSSVQIGPAFTLSLYMLFSGHAYRPHDADGIRETTWKEVIHKARVKLLRVSLDSLQKFPPHGTESGSTDAAHLASDGSWTDNIPAENRMHEFAYQLVIIEDLDDDRMHDFEDEQEQPEAFEDVAQAGLREIIPIHEISKIFYADTGKILNIGAEGEANSPILLLKRDINAIPPRRMMERQAGPADDESDSPATEKPEAETLQVDEQSEIDAQLHRESSVDVRERETAGSQSQDQKPSSRWRLPLDLDPEWIALEVYTEEPDSDDDEDLSQEELSSSPLTGQGISRGASLTSQLASLHLGNAGMDSPSTNNLGSLPSVSSPPAKASSQSTAVLQPSTSSAPTTLPSLRSSLSLLELLIRLTALQQFQQSSHLAIADELLTFFLSESASTTGAGADRQRTRRYARQRLGFDPYNESPVKIHGEAYQYRDSGPSGSGGGYREGSVASSSAWSRREYDYAQRPTPSAYDWEDYDNNDQSPLSDFEYAYPTIEQGTVPRHMRQPSRDISAPPRSEIRTQPAQSNVHTPPPQPSFRRPAHRRGGSGSGSGSGTIHTASSPLATKSSPMAPPPSMRRQSPRSQPRTPAASSPTPPNPSRREGSNSNSSSTFSARQRGGRGTASVRRGGANAKSLRTGTGPGLQSPLRTGVSANAGTEEGDSADVDVSAGVHADSSLGTSPASELLEGKAKDG